MPERIPNSSFRIPNFVVHSKVRLESNAIRKFTSMRRRTSRGTPSRFASRRSASRKTVASTRRPVGATAVLPVRHIRALKSRVAANAPARTVATRPPRILASRRFSRPRRLAFTARCARRRPASPRSAVTPSAARRREPAGDGPLDFACAGDRRQPRPEADRARRRRFATGVRLTRLPNRLLAAVRTTPGGVRFVSTRAGGRGCHANRPRPATAGSRRLRSGDLDPAQAPTCQISEFPKGIKVSALRTRPRITVPLWTPMHPAWLRCSSLTYSRYARSSRLAMRAPRRP